MSPENILEESNRWKINSKNSCLLIKDFCENNENSDNCNIDCNIYN